MVGRVVFASVAAAACLLAVPAELSCEAAPGGSFVERFAPMHSKRWVVSNGWANGDYQGCVFAARNVRQLGNGVELRLDDSGQMRPFACAELQSRAAFGYGTFEVRLRSAAGPGLVTSFFTYTGPGQGTPHDEIDFEFLGKNSRSVQLNYFVDGKGLLAKHIALDNDASTTFSDYAFEWLDTAMRWYVNGRLVHEVHREAGKPFPTHPGHIIISLWNGQGASVKDWLEEFKYPGAPIEAVYESISYTAAGAPCQFPSSIVCRKAAP
jgi:endo-1,3-1,4-beta-glycanase ExoK